jgi:hypothetical protein
MRTATATTLASNTASATATIAIFLREFEIPERAIVGCRLSCFAASTTTCPRASTPEGSATTISFRLRFFRQLGWD